jgi:hypothetical protein
MPQFAYIAPFRSQAKSVAWDYLKHFSAPAAASTNESELTVDMINGSKVRLFGADNADAMRGLGFDGLFMDEYGDFKPSVFGNVLRPALADKTGWCVFAGTPKGRNQFYDIYQTAQRIPDEWFVLRLPASDSGLKELSRGGVCACAHKRSACAATSDGRSTPSRTRATMRRCCAR